MCDDCFAPAGGWAARLRRRAEDDGIGNRPKVKNTPSSTFSVEQVEWGQSTSIIIVIYIVVECII